MDTQQLEQQTVEAITAWAKDRTLKIECSETGSIWYGAYNQTVGSLSVRKYYRLAPDPLDEIAPGHNPAKLTVRQVGEGWRLLEREEICNGEDRLVEGWVTGSKEGWVRGCIGSDPLMTYRTQRPPGYFLPKPEPARYTVEEIAEYLSKRSMVVTKDYVIAGLNDPEIGIAAVVARKGAK